MFKHINKRTCGFFGSILLTSSACGIASKSSEIQSQDNSSIRENLKSYYSWIYEDQARSQDKLTKISELEKYLNQVDIFRLSDEQSRQYLELCQKQEVPENVCNDALEIQKFYRSQQDDSKPSHKDRCHGLTCGYTAG